MKLVEKQGNNGIKFRAEQPTTPKEFDDLAKRENACVEEACDNVWYRGVLPDAWGGLAEKLLELFPALTRKLKDHPAAKKDAAGKILQVDAESDPQYVNRVLAHFGANPGDINGANPLIYVQGIADEFINPNLKFDPSARARTGPSSTEPTKTDVETAKALWAQGKKKLLVSLAKIEAVLGSKVVLPDPTGDAAADEAAALRVISMAVKGYRMNPLAGLKA